MNTTLHTLRIKTLVTCFIFIIMNSSLSALTYTMGSYVGNGTSQNITGLAFTPQLVFVKSSGAYSAIVKTKDMASTASKQYTSSTALLTTAITALNSGGFSVGSSTLANKSGTTYYFYAFVS